MTINEMVMIAFYENRQPVEIKRKDKDSFGGDFNWMPLPVKNPLWDFNMYDYRVVPTKRFLTLKELWGKTLINKDGDMSLVCSGKISNNTIWDGSNSHTVGQLHKMGWRVAGPDYDYNTANSLETV